MDTSEQDQLEREFNEWSGGEEKIIKLELIQRDQEGKASIKFVVDEDQKFILHCPTSYPDLQEDENFFVEADTSLQLWCNALNEFMLDSDHSLSLAVILSKGVSLYSSKDKEDFSEDDVDLQDDELLDDMLDQDLNWGLEVARRKKRWKSREDSLRAGAGTEGGDQAGSLGQVYHDPSIKNRQPKQVFTSAAASGILTNDLVAIMEDKSNTSIKADTIDDNIFQWNVKISDFDDKALNEDFQILSEEFGYDYIELQLDFSMDLYPFFPPLVKVIRPRLQGSMMLRVTTMEMLKLTYWDPARDMMSVLVDIKSFLSTWARLDIFSERNDQVRYPDGAYIDIEHHLLRLALVSEVTPRANKKYVASQPSVQLPPSAVETPCSSSATSPPEVKTEELLTNKKGKNWILVANPAQWFTDKKKKESDSVKSQAKGVGYSSYPHKGWDVKAYEAAQREQDKQIQLVLERICTELRRLHSVTTVQPRNLPDLLVEAAAKPPTGLPSVELVELVEPGRPLSQHRKRKHSPDPANGPIDPLSDLYAVLEGSALVPFLESKLQSNSFLEISRHAAVYRMIINIVREMSSQSCLVSLLGPLADQKCSLHSLLQGIETQAGIMIDRIGKASANGSVPKPDKPGRSSNEALETANAGGDTLARQFLSLSKEVTQALKKTGYLPDINSGYTSVHDQSSDARDPSPQPGPSGLSVASDDISTQYNSVLSQLQFDTVEFDSNCHVFQAEFDKAGSPSSQIIFRVAQEVSSLAAPNSLPVSPSSSIFVRSDDDKSTLLKTVISGPEDTPYTSGLYEFDIYFPNKYPAVPPKVSFRTTGGGLVRFNPNLYNCGKVCLSLLGTWDGAQGEQWSAETSTIIQVLISIQSLILCAEPYFNEPGFESSYGTSTGEQESKRYNEDVLKNNMRFAILGQLSSPPEGFKEVTKAHFYLKRHNIIKELERQAEVYKSKETMKLVSEVKEVLLNMKKPDEVKVPN